MNYIQTKQYNTIYNLKGDAAGSLWILGYNAFVDFDKTLDDIYSDIFFSKDFRDNLKVAVDEVRQSLENELFDMEDQDRK